MRTYKIRAGASFVTTDKEGKPVTLTGGQEIQLEDDIAATHARLLDPFVQTPGPNDTPASAEAGTAAGPGAADDAAPGSAESGGIGGP